MTPSEMGKRGGPAAAASLSPEQRTERASRGGAASWASLTREQRRERALRGKPTRAAREAGSKAGRALAESFLNAVPVAPPKKRSEMRVGSMNARVLDIVREKGPIVGAQIGDHLIPSEPAITVRNALSSLRTAGHVESVELAGSKREKLWRVK